MMTNDDRVRALEKKIEELESNIIISQDSMRKWGNIFFLVSFIIMMIIVASLVSAENVSVSQATNLTISCNNASQCVAYGSSGTPTFFSALESNTTILVTQTFTYEKNETVLVNNYTIVTQNVSIENCSIPPEIDQEGIKQSLINALQPAVDSSCQAACNNAAQSVTDCQNRLQGSMAAEQAALVELEKTKAEYLALQNISESRLTAVNATLSSQIDIERSGKYPWIILAFILLTLSAGVFGLMYYKSRTLNANKGTKVVEPLPRFDE